MDAEDLLKGLMAHSVMRGERTARDKTDDSIEDLSKAFLKAHEFKIGIAES